MATPLPSSYPTKLESAKPQVDVKRAFALAVQGNTYADIGRIMGVTKAAIMYHIKPMMDLMGEPGKLQVYQANKADILEGIQLSLARDLLDPEKRRKATLGNVAYAIRQLNDIMRLERDQSTSNVALAHVEAIQTMQEVDAEIAKITEELPTGRSTDGAMPEQLAEDKRVKAIEEQIARITGQDIDSIDDVIDVEPDAGG